MNIEPLKNASNLLFAKLSYEGYHESCNCRSCDALRKVDEARKEINSFLAEVVSSENPSAESQAQERAKAVADREISLAVAYQIQNSGMRYNLYYRDKLVMTAYTHDIVAWSMRTRVAVEFHSH